MRLLPFSSKRKRFQNCSDTRSQTISWIASVSALVRPCQLLAVAVVLEAVAAAVVGAAVLPAPDELSIGVETKPRSWGCFECEKLGKVIIL